MALTELQKELLQIIKVNNKIIVDQLVKEFRKVLREELEYTMEHSVSTPKPTQNRNVDTSAIKNKFQQMNESKLTKMNSENLDDDLNFDFSFDSTPVPLVDNTPFYNEDGQIVNPERLAKNPQAKQVLQMMQTDYSNLL